MLDLVHKFWNKGVDIGANVIASVIVGCVALLLWRGKLWLELRADASKHRQKRKMDDDAEQFRRLVEGNERYSRLSDERNNFATAAVAARDTAHLAELWDKYLGWMESNGLQFLSGNLSIQSKYAKWSSSLRSRASTAEAVGAAALEMETLINGTALREPEPWEPKDAEYNAALRKRSL